MTPHESADELIRRNDGVISRREAENVGLSKRQITVLLANRRWTSVLNGIYRGSQHELSAAAWVRAVVLWAGTDAILSGLAAAWWWGLCSTFDNVVEVVIPHRRTLVVPAEHRGRIRISRQFIDPKDHTKHQDLAVISPSLATLIGMIRHRVGGSEFLDRTLQRHLSLQELQRAAARHPGLHGAKQINRLLTIAADGAAAESERMLARLFREAGIVGWRINRGISVR